MMKYQIMRANGIETWSDFERDVIQGLTNRICAGHKGLDWHKVREMVLGLFHSEN